VPVAHGVQLPVEVDCPRDVDIDPCGQFWSVHEVAVPPDEEYVVIGHWMHYSWVDVAPVCVDY